VDENNPHATHLGGPVSLDGDSALRTAMGWCTLVGMEICELTAVTLIAAPPPRPPTEPRAQATTSPRMA
jgi:hypothetical protein